MEIDEDKIDDAVLALLWLTLHNERWAWKGFDWASEAVVRHAVSERDISGLANSQLTDSPTALSRTVFDSGRNWGDVTL
ncbi:DUF6429 family protein [Rhizobium johnstonii]|uniref:DUF6429 family protein n=1 Tax=Rhizobium johnstonii TaxID=3019933 RepID=UPI003F9AC7A5